MGEQYCREFKQDWIYFAWVSRQYFGVALCNFIDCRVWHFRLDFAVWQSQFFILKSIFKHINERAKCSIDFIKVLQTIIDIVHCQLCTGWIESSYCYSGYGKGREQHCILALHNSAIHFLFTRTHLSIKHCHVVHFGRVTHSSRLEWHSTQLTYWVLVICSQKQVLYQKLTLLNYNHHHVHIDSLVYN